MPKSDPESLRSALDYLRIARRRKWWLILSTILVAAAALGYSKTEPKRYSANASVLVQGMPIVTPQNGVTPQPIGSTGPATQVQIAESSPIREAVLHSIGKGGAVTVTAVGSTDVLLMAATAKTPQRAALLANTYAKAFVTYDAAQVAQRITAVENQLQGRLTGLKTLIAADEAQLAGPPVGSTSTSTTSTPASTQAIEAQLLSALADDQVVQGDLEQLQATSGATNSPAQLVSPAVVPTGPSSPKTTRNVALGIAAGLVLGLILCLVVDSLDDRIRTKTELQELLGGIPVLGLIPDVPQWKAADKAFLVSVAAPQSAPAESYRSLRTALQFALLEKDAKRILVSSGVLGEGKTSTTANLGVAMARAGLQVLVVSADLRRPRLGEFLECSETVGLSSVVLGSHTLDEAIQRVDGARGLSFLGTGAVPPDPAEFLASRAVAEIMEGLSDRFDLIIVDCAPMIPVADTLVAATWSDTILLVVRDEYTRRRHVRRTRELLDNSNVDVCGVVFNSASIGEGTTAGYGYYGAYGTYGGAHHRRRKGAAASTSGPDTGAASARDAG